jgi:hypothetical protein
MVTRAPRIRRSHPKPHPANLRWSGVQFDILPADHAISIYETLFCIFRLARHLAVSSVGFRQEGFRRNHIARIGNKLDARPRSSGPANQASRSCSKRRSEQNRERITRGSRLRMSICPILTDTYQRSAVHRQRNAGNERCFVGGQEQRRVGDVPATGAVAL